jgi:hypothetical protein
LKNLSETALQILTQLDAARLEGQDNVRLHVGYRGKSFAALTAAGLIEAHGDHYNITELGSHALAAGQYEPGNPKPRSNGNGIRPYTPPVTPNGKAIGEHPCVLPCSGDCAHKRVLEIVASRYPSVRALLEAVERFEEETK